MTALPYSRQQDLPRRYTDRPLTPQEQHLLDAVRARQAIVVPPPSPELRYLLSTGLLLHIPSLYGPVLILGLAGRHACGMGRGVLSDDRAADVLYFRLALVTFWEKGYRPNRRPTTTRAIIQRGPHPSILMARLSNRGPSRYEVAKVSKQASNEGSDVIVVTTNTAAYAQLLKCHPHLSVYELAPPASPTTARNAP
jgi:hypothetical protein